MECLIFRRLELLIDGYSALEKAGITLNYMPRSLPDKYGANITISRSRPIILSSRIPELTSIKMVNDALQLQNRRKYYPLFTVEFTSQDP
jgi:hypothetical protein